MFSKEFIPNRGSEKEQARIADLFALIPVSGNNALDIGARDGYLSKRLAERFKSVVALDLKCPCIEHPHIENVAGDVTQLQYPDHYFDFVLCSEVLEHIPPSLLPKACAEIARVTRDSALIGVPYRQDLRTAQTTCRSCGKSNPPYGHLNSFDESRLRSLFSTLEWKKASYVGLCKDSTNSTSVALLDYAGNPYGTYDQEESCVYCGALIDFPRQRTVLQRIATRLAMLLINKQNLFFKPHPAWIHVLFIK